MGEDEQVVLVVEDEQPLVEIYTRWLENTYEVRSALSGEQALEVVDDSVAVVLLDRIMTGMTGDDVLAEFHDRDLDCMVAMVTAVEPDFDLIAIGVDAYLTKPVNRDELLTTVSRLLDRRVYADLEREFFQLVSKRATLRANTADSTLQSNEEYAELNTQIADVRERLDEESDSMDDTEFIALVRDIDDTNHHDNR